MSPTTPSPKRSDAREASATTDGSSPAEVTARKLVAHQNYFGLEARAFQAGAHRMLQRLGAQPGQHAAINSRTLAQDFFLDAAAAGTLLRAFLSAGLLYPDGNGGYEATARFRDYALAQMIVPLSRSQAKELIHTACRFAARINADPTRSPLVIDAMAVSGDYMTGRDPLPELSLWLVLRQREPQEAQRAPSSMTRDGALRQIVATMKGLGPVVEVRIVSDKQKVQRPFTMVFEAKEELIEPPRAWNKLRDWRSLIGQREPSRQLSAELAHHAPKELVTVQRKPRTVQTAKSAWGGVGKRG